MRIACRALALLLLCGGAVPLLADEPTSEAFVAPGTPAKAADLVVEALQAEASATLEALARLEEPDPWLVADALCARMEFEAARAYAEAAEGAATADLRAYVIAQAAEPVEAAHRLLVTRMIGELERGDWAAAVASSASIPGIASVPGIRITYGRGVALLRMERYAESRQAFEGAASEALALGWLRRAEDAYRRAGRSAGLAGHVGAMHALWKTRVEVAERLENPARLTEALLDHAGCLASVADLQGALATAERVVRLTQGIGDYTSMARALDLQGNIHREVRATEAALEAFGQSLEIQQERGVPAAAAAVLDQIGLVYEQAKRYDEALETYRASLRISEALGDRVAASITWQSVGNVHNRLRRYDEARAAYQRSADLAREADDRAGLASALNNLGLACRRLGAYEEALEAYREAVAIREALGAVRRLALTYSNLGVVYRRLGRYAEAIEAYRLALTNNEHYGDPRGRLKILTNLGVLHGRLGAYERALDLHGQALALAETLGAKEAVQDALTNIGVIYLRRGKEGDLESALAMHRRALAAAEALDDPQSVCDALNNVGAALDRLARYSEALPAYERSLRLAEALGDRAGVGITLSNLGNAHEMLGNLVDAREAYGRSLELLEDTRDVTARIKALWSRARLEVKEAAFAAAIADARRATAEALSLAEGLAEGESATARELWAGLLEVGVHAARKAGDLEALLYFMESARAGTLREALGNATALREALIPPELQVLVDEAKLREQQAFAAYRQSWDGPRRDRRVALQTWTQAKSALEDAVAQVRRGARRGASIMYAAPDDLATLRGQLQDDEALVLYAFAGPHLVALVVRRDGARAVTLGDADAARGVVGAFLQEDYPFLETDEVGAMQGILVDRLTLGEDVHRVLVAPAERLGYVPFALLMPEREVAFVPSGTVYGLLRSEAPPPGDGVLGLGAPAYPEGSGLTLLPGTRPEVESIATKVLLGEHATEAALRVALAERDRWHAVHLACHGLIDPEHPAQCALAFTPGAEDDGMLTALDVFGMTIPADLAVLSACDTARGRAYRVEGIVGLTQAFMVAGAPGVLCSLWKVDDQATQALMTKFYELWRPGEGGGAAAALKRAQAYVRDHPDHPEWKRPYFWAAWVLWGLPE